MNFLSFSLPTLFFIFHIILIALLPPFIFLVSVCFFLFFRVVPPFMDYGSSRLPGPFKIKFKLDYRDFFGGRPLSHVSPWSAVAASLKADGLTQHGEYLCQVEEKQLLDESIRSTRNTLYISNFPWKQNLELLGDRIFVIWEVDERNPRNLKFSNENIL